MPVNGAYFGLDSLMGLPGARIRTERLLLPPRPDRPLQRVDTGQRSQPSPPLPEALPSHLPDGQPG